MYQLHIPFYGITPTFYTSMFYVCKKFKSTFIPGIFFIFIVNYCSTAVCILNMFGLGGLETSIKLLVPHTAQDQITLPLWSTFMLKHFFHASKILNSGKLHLWPFSPDHRITSEHKHLSPVYENITTRCIIMCTAHHPQRETRKQTNPPYSHIYTCIDGFSRSPYFHFPIEF